MSSQMPQQPSGRFGQMRQAYRLTKKTDPKMPWAVLLAFLLIGGLFAAFFLWMFGTDLIGIITASISGVLTGILAGLIVFSRRAERSAYAQVEGTPGAAAGVVEMLRGWHSKPAVAFTRNQDIVHRVVGRPGVVLLGEGDGHRVRQLLASEKKKHARIVGEAVPITEIVVGRGTGEVPLPKLTKHLKKLPKAIKPGEMTDIVNKLKALDAMRPQAPMPRGPMPSMKGARRAMRG